MSDNTLHLYFTKPEFSSVDEGETFVISEDISDEHDWFARFAALDFSQDSTFSYDLFWPHLVLPSRGNLLIYAAFYSTLSERIDSENITQLVSHNLERGYQLVAEDLAEEYSINVEHQQEARNRLVPTSKILLRLSVVLLFVDQILSIIKERIRPSTSTWQQRPLFFPYPGRYESMLPVIQEMEYTSTIIVSPLTISWRSLNPVSDWPDAHETKTLSEFSDLITLKKELTELFRFQVAMIWGKPELSELVDSTLRDEYNAQLSHTIEYVCKDIVHRDIRLVLSLYVIERAIDQLEPSSVVVGGMNPRDRYMLEVGEKVGADLFYIPHSIAYSREIIPHTAETTHFVAGEADKRVLQDRYSEDQLPDIQPLGRPYFGRITKLQNSLSENADGPRIVLGTQPYPDWMRKQFVRDILEVLDDLGFSEFVLIKIHPSESPGFYQKILQEAEYDFEIDIKRGDITSFITAATTLITINSNVGIESILAGGFCISYNPFEPFTQQSSYIDGEHVPYITTPMELQKKLETLFPIDNTLRKRQRLYIREAFTLKHDPDQIAKQIQKVS